LVTQNSDLTIKARKKRTIRVGGVGIMSEGKEHIVAEHPKPRVVRMVEGWGMRVADKTLY